MANSTYTPELAARICDGLAAGRSMRSILTDEGIPGNGTIYRWLEANADFREQYARAREAQAETLFDEILDIADDGRNDWMQRQNYDGAEIGWHVNGEAQARSRIRIDARKWMAGKLQPKKYGDKIGVDQTVSVSPDLASLMERVAGHGKRLAPKDEEPE